MSDAWIGIVGAILGAVIGGSLGFVSAWFPKYREDRQRRQALATALLSEICALEQILRRYALGELDRLVFGPYQTAMYDHAGANLLLFASETMQALSGLYRMVHTTLIEINEGGRSPYLIVATLGLINEAAARLRTEGGKWPCPVPSIVDPSSSVPTLPPPVFEGNE